MVNSWWLDNIKNKSSIHPWDWIAHILLGFVAYLINYFLMKILGKPPENASLLAAFNVVLVVELVQIDIFGMSWKRFGDTTIDLIAGVFGIVIASVLL